MESSNFSNFIFGSNAKLGLVHEIPRSHRPLGGLPVVRSFHSNFSGNNMSKRGKYDLSALISAIRCPSSEKLCHPRRPIRGAWSCAGISVDKARNCEISPNLIFPSRGKRSKNNFLFERETNEFFRVVSGRGGSAGGKFRISLACPVGAVMNCADNTGE